MEDIDEQISLKEKTIEMQEMNINNSLLTLKLLHNELRQLIREQHLAVIYKLQKNN